MARKLDALFQICVETSRCVSDIKHSQRELLLENTSLKAEKSQLQNHSSALKSERVSLNQHVSNLQGQVAALTTKLSKFTTPPRRFDMEQRAYSLAGYEVDVEAGACLLNALDSVGVDNAQILDEATVSQPGVANTAVAEAIVFFWSVARGNSSSARRCIETS